MRVGDEDGGDGIRIGGAGIRRGYLNYTHCIGIHVYTL